VAPYFAVGKVAAFVVIQIPVMLTNDGKINTIEIIKKYQEDISCIY